MAFAALISATPLSVTAVPFRSTARRFGKRGEHIDGFIVDPAAALQLQLFELGSDFIFSSQRTVTFMVLTVANAGSLDADTDASAAEAQLAQFFERQHGVKPTSDMLMDQSSSRCLACRSGPDK